MDYSKRRKELIEELNRIHNNALVDGYTLLNDNYVKEDKFYVLEMYNYSVGTTEEYGYFNIIRETKFITEKTAKKFEDINLIPYSYKDSVNINRDLYNDEVEKLFYLLSIESNNFYTSLEYNSQLEFIYDDDIYQCDKNELEAYEQDLIGIKKVYFELKFEQIIDSFTSHGYISVFEIQKDKYEKLPDLNEHFSKTIKDN